ncbi:imm11 family protein [Hyalangium rubrum]|uniref:Immunity MXAN-0049 protein domain-containing protein n=1 Tax=Hyalangium rubrum TaxID=3103134 RepID=A0ABU5HHF7_9BACT|nr:DUF1629 domain-containing protein [Hyalangium sp. s54d21]MDY7232894.1 hypothetical protein [Hyalangium sp. s54d21]
MSRRFYRLVDDVYVPRRWHLATPLDGQGHKVDCWDFTKGAAVKSKGRLRIPLEHAGSSLDFSEAGVMVPVVHVKAASVFTERASSDVQLLPVDVEGQPDQYLVLVATRSIRCIDEKASKVQRWKPEDGLPDMVGKYYAVDDLHIDEAKVGPAKVFRPEGWEVALIVSRDIKEALEAISATGVKFEQV